MQQSFALKTQWTKHRKLIKQSGQWPKIDIYGRREGQLSLSSTILTFNKYSHRMIRYEKKKKMNKYQFLRKQGKKDKSTEYLQNKQL